MNLICNELKKRNIPVSGVDRVLLKDEIVVEEYEGQKIDDIQKQMEKLYNQQKEGKTIRLNNAIWDYTLGAIEAIKQGQRNVMVGYRNNDIVYVPFSECIRTDKRFDKRLITVLDELSI